jgi:hypothetical protein
MPCAMARFTRRAWPFQLACLSVTTLVAGCTHTPVGQSAQPAAATQSECRIGLGSTATNATPEVQAQDRLVARAALLNSSARWQALQQRGAGSSIYEELLWECERGR